MRRLIALLASVTVVLVVAAAPVAADSGAPSSTSPTSSPQAASQPTSSPAAIPADAVGVTPALVVGSGLPVTLDPGASEEHDVVVSNHTANLRLTVKLEATDATGTLGTGAATWLTFGDDAIQLDPHAATTVPMTVAVPHDTQPGSSLAHIRATVESAVAAADGTPVSGTAVSTFPVSIVVSGTPTAQIAIADVHRVDQGSTHQLAVVLRNFGAQGARVSGHVRVAGDTPQTLTFSADLGASRDTTIDLDWKAPPIDAETDVAVDLEYGTGDVATWSSRLGGSASDISSVSTTIAPAPVATPNVAAGAATSSSATPGKPLWKQPLAAALVLAALLAAGVWFAFEIRAARRRAFGPALVPYAIGPGSGVGASEESLDLARQIVRLTDVVVQLVEAHRAGLDVAPERARARSPDAGGRDDVALPADVADPANRPVGPPASREARAGPEPAHRDAVEPDAPQAAEAPARVPDAPPPLPRPLPSRPRNRSEDATRSTSPTPGAVSRPEPADPGLSAMERLVELDRQRRRLRMWMDNEDSGLGFAPTLPGADAGGDV